MSIPLLACSGGLEKVKMEDKPLAHPLPINTQPRTLAISSCSIGIKDDGTVWSWGHDFHGCLGRKIERYDQGYIPAQVQGIKDAVSVVAYDQILILKKDGTVWSWGGNKNRELGYDTEGKYSDVPRQIPELQDVVDIGVTWQSSFIVKRDGTVWGFGNSWNGMFGVDSHNEKQPLTLVQGLKDIVKISIGGGVAVALDKYGKAWTWGYSNSVGRMGKRMDRVKVLPAMMGFIEKVSDVVCLGSAGIALLSDGSVWSWGSNHGGELGRELSGGVISLLPEKIKSINQVVKIAGKSSIATAVTQKGDLVAWGQAILGSELNGPFLKTARSPVLIKKNVSIKYITSGLDTMAYVDDSGQAWYWMNNRYGQFGNGRAIEEPSNEEWVTPQKSLWTTR